ncbi:hypothetical protein JCM8097_000759 [Rhodosporidiobolus ruineniae]
MPSAQPDVFTPFTLGGGTIELSHRIVMAPLTRNRATPSEKHARTMAQYYGERATEGGLIISEATPVSLVASGCSGVPGIFTDEQVEGWKKITAAVHAKGGLIFQQLWHQGRNAHSSASGLQPVSSSAVPITDSMHMRPGLPVEPFEVPHPLTVEEIAATQEDFVKGALRSREAGFDGIEIHAANGYLFDQFQHDNINQRTDQYGGSIENRNRFTIETVDKIIAAIGADRFGVRLAPFGLFNQTRGTQREEQWTALTKALSNKGLAYLHFIEPRFDELRTEADKMAELGQSNSLANIEVSLKPYREASVPTPVIAAGGYNYTNMNDGLGAEHDLVAMGRYFTSNADLVDRLRTGKKLFGYDRSRFYGPFEDNEIGYTVHPGQVEEKEPDSRPQLIL